MVGRCPCDNPEANRQNPCPCCGMGTFLIHSHPATIAVETFPPGWSWTS